MTEFVRNKEFNKHERYIRAALQQAGFDFAKPNPALAWRLVPDLLQASDPKTTEIQF